MRLHVAQFHSEEDCKIKDDIFWLEFSKNETTVLGNAIPVLGVKPKRGGTYFGHFSRQTYVQPHQWKALAENFWIIWLNKGLSEKITKIRTTPIFLKIGLCSATSMESSRRELLNDVAEHRSIWKNNHNKHFSDIFEDRPMFSNINGKLSPRPFQWYGWT